MDQLLMSLCGLTAIWWALGSNPHLRKWAPIVGLAGQPFWLWYALKSQAAGVDSRGLMLLIAAFSLVYLRGIWVQWWQS